jgi:hypothetical protein
LVEPWDHAAPWWYYLKYLWIDMAPWAWLLPLAWGPAPADRRERRLHRLGWVWIAAFVIFFSLSPSKRSPYILPVAPAVAWLAASVADRWVDGRGGSLRAAWLRGLLLTLGAACLGSALSLVRNPDVPTLIDPSVGWSFVALLGAVGLLALGGALLARRRALGTLLLVPGLLYLGASAALPAIDGFKSHRGFCRAMRRHVGPQDPLAGFHAWRWRAGYSYYSGRRIPNLETTAELREYWSRDERVFLIVEFGRLERAHEVIGDAQPLEWRSIGSTEAYLFSNRPPQEEKARQSR